MDSRKAFGSGTGARLISRLQVLEFLGSFMGKVALYQKVVGRIPEGHSETFHSSIWVTPGCPSLVRGDIHIQLAGNWLCYIKMLPHLFAESPVGL